MATLQRLRNQGEAWLTNEADLDLSLVSGNLDRITDGTNSLIVQPAAGLSWPPGNFVVDPRSNLVIGAGHVVDTGATTVHNVVTGTLNTIGTGAAGNMLVGISNTIPSGVSNLVFGNGNDFGINGTGNVVCGLLINDGAAGAVVYNFVQGNAHTVANNFCFVIGPLAQTTSADNEFRAGFNTYRFQSTAATALTDVTHNATTSWSYNALTPADWGGAGVPASMSEALDRISSVVAANHGAIP